MKKAWRPKCRALFSVYIWLSHKDKHFEKNLKFIKDLKIPSECIIHISRKSATVIACTDAKMLTKIKSDPRCLDVSRFICHKPEKTSDIILAEMSADTLSDNISDGASGLGVSFGMISAEREIFSLASPQLLSAQDEGRINVIPYPVPPIPSLHPSVVLCQIIGESTVVNSQVFRGMAPDASVFFSTSETSLDVLRAIETLIGLGIRVINLSAGIMGLEEYSAFDRQIDRLIEENNLLLVVPSGNRRNVASPGSAFNTLTVGNLQTKSSPDTEIPPPWNTRCTSGGSCSGFRTNEEYPHKPDVCAPGTFIPYVTPTGGIYSENIGTSFACPWVSGIALRLLERSPDLSALELKAVIALSCRRDVISDEFNERLVGEPFAKVRSGFGCVNAARAEEFVRNGLIETVITTGFDRREYRIFEGQVFFSAVCFNKNTERQGEDLTLRLADSFGNTVVCNRRNQNLHVVEYTATSDTTLIMTIEGNAGVVCAVAVYIL